MPQVLYNVVTSIDRSDGLSYRITKFVDGEVESSYLTSRTECECLAGHRSTCRHRQMLPQMLNNGILNTPWFIDWDNASRNSLILDFEGRQVPIAQIEETLALEDTSQDTQPSPVHHDLFTLPQYNGVAIREVESLEPPKPGWRRF